MIDSATFFLTGIRKILSGVLLSALLFGAGCGASSGKNSLVIGNFQSQSYAEGQDEPIAYLFQLPRNPRPGEVFPLIMVCHGRGQVAGDAMDEWAEDAKKYGFAILAPALDGTYENTLESMRGFYDVIDSIKKKYPIDPKRIVVAGVSAGGLIATRLVNHAPERWQASVFIASPPFDWLFFEQKNLDQFPPMLFVHGVQDPQFDIKEVRECVTKVKARSIHAALIEYPDAGHEHRPEWNKRIFEWIENVERTDKSPAA